MSLPHTKLVEKVQAADGTMSFHFEKPSGFDYKAGQFADYTLLNPAETDDEDSTRGFTLASAPFEATLTATTRLRDTAFKRVLKNMPIGTELDEHSTQGWDGETGFVDTDMIARYVEDMTTPIYYLCGPGGTVTAIRTLLNTTGVDDDEIRTEEFTGY